MSGRTTTGISALSILVISAASAWGSTSAEETNAAVTETESSVDAAEVSRILALSDDLEYGEYLAGECASCHQADSSSESSVPGIHGLEADRLVSALLEYRSGIRPNTTMGLIANNMDEEAMAALAHYLAMAEH